MSTYLHYGDIFPNVEILKVETVAMSEHREKMEWHIEEELRKNFMKTQLSSIML